jgi:hypothetical protein
MPFSGLGCSSAALRRALALGGWPPRVFAVLPAPIAGRRSETGRARYWPPIRTAMLSYEEHGRSRADSQGRAFISLVPRDAR